MTEQEVKKIVFQYLQDHLDVEFTLTPIFEHGFVEDIDYDVSVRLTNPETDTKEDIV